MFGIPHDEKSEQGGPPLITLAGGPGSEGLENYALWKLPALIRSDRDVVAFDMRGTGPRYAIDCPEVQAASASAEEYTAAVSACGAQLGGAADDYGAVDHALDIEAIRVFMGYDRVSLHAQGYATVTAQAYAARFPDRLAAVVVDSGFTVDEPAATFGVDMPGGMIDAVERTCAADPECAATTPDPRAVVVQTIRTLAETPIVVGDVVADDASIGAG